MLLALYGVAYFAAALTGLDTCGGDGGSPYAAPASPRGKYCDSGLPWISLLAGLMLALVGALVAIGSRRWPPLLPGAAIGAALVPSSVVVGVSLSESCGDEPAAITADQSERYRAPAGVRPLTTR